MSALPYLTKMAKGGDAEALDALRKMRDDGDDDAADALNSMGDGNGAQPDMPLGKSSQGEMFDLEALEKALDDIEPFSDVENAPAATVDDIRNDISGRPEVEAAAAVDAGDFVKSLASGIESALERNGDVAAWAAQAAEAVAQGFGAQGDLLKSVTDSNDRLSKSIDALKETLSGLGAGTVGATDTVQAAALAKSFAGPSDEPVPQPGPSGRSVGEEAQELRKSLRDRREGLDPSERPMLGKINNALDALTHMDLNPARKLLAANG
jgi:hypothetical protein